MPGVQFSACTIFYGEQVPMPPPDYVSYCANLGCFRGKASLTQGQSLLLTMFTHLVASQEEACMQENFAVRECEDGCA